MDVSGRIRRARQDLDLTQQQLGTKVGVHWRTVQGWEAGRHPRGKAAAQLERVLGIDLTASPTGTAPQLDEATDQQIVAELMARLADRDAQVRQLNKALAEENR